MTDAPPSAPPSRRLGFALAWLLLGVPSMYYLLVYAAYATFLMLPFGLFTLLTGQRTASVTREGLNTAGLGLLGVCGSIALVHLVWMSVAYLSGGAPDLVRRRRTLVLGLLWAIPPLVFYGLPSMREVMEHHGGPDAWLAGLYQSGFLLVPLAAWLALEAFRPARA